MNNKPGINKLTHFIICACVILSVPGHARAKVMENKVKAEMLERFALFLEWPESANIEDKSTPFVIAVIGKNTFDPKLEDIFSGRKIRDKEIRIRYLSTPDETIDCHVLFISSSEKESLGRIIAKTRKKPILTVSDTKGFSEEGVFINFYLEEKKIRFEINETAAYESGFYVSYKLLQLARIIKPRIRPATGPNPVRNSGP